MSRKLWCLAMAAIWAGGLIGFSRADDNDTYNSVKELEAKRKERVMANQTIWWEHFVPGRIEEKKKIAEGKAEAANKDAKDKEAAKPKPAETASVMQQEMQKYLRREDVCRRLREVAEETKDQELAKQADILESRAWAAYEQKITSTRLPRVSPSRDDGGDSKPAKNSTTFTSTDANSVHSIPADGKE
jgi:hypothetical protein